MLRKSQILGFGAIDPYICTMTFKQLALELMQQGWRCYHISDVDKLTRGSTLQALAVRNLIEVQVYEGKSLVFVKNTKPKK